MRAAGLVALLLAAAAIGAVPAAAHADRDWYHSARTWIETMLATHDGGDDIISPPAGIDPKMVVKPPRERGALRVIPPPSSPGR